MTRVDYVCGFCGKQGFAEAEIHPSIRVKAEAWGAMMCCNRCADYFSAANRIKQRVAEECCSLRFNGFNDQLEERVRKRLILLTRQFAEITAYYYRKNNRWEPHTVDKLIKEPGRAWSIMCEFAREIKNGK